MATQWHGSLPTSVRHLSLMSTCNIFNLKKNQKKKNKEINFSFCRLEWKVCCYLRLISWRQYCFMDMYLRGLHHVISSMSMINASLFFAFLMAAWPLLSHKVHLIARQLTQVITEFPKPSGFSFSTESQILREEITNVQSTLHTWEHTCVFYDFWRFTPVQRRHATPSPHPQPRWRQLGKINKPQ